MLVALRRALVLCSLAIASGMRAAPNTKLLVIGGNGFVGREVCKYAVQRGFDVTSLSRRGLCPDPEDELLSQVDWQAGNALDKATVNKYVNDADAVVHAIGLLFDVNSGLESLNMFTSFSKSEPDPESTYDNITRKTALLVIAALRARLGLPVALGGKRIPMAFVYASLPMPRRCLTCVAHHAPHSHALTVTSLNALDVGC